jgi:hypothetical protein
LLLLCSLVAACSLRGGRFELPPRQVANRTVHPWRVGVIVGREFMPYTMRFRWWSSTPFTWTLEGLPDAFVDTLDPYFLSVEPLRVDESVSAGRHDLIAKMSVDRLHFDGANTTTRSDRVDLVMTFRVEQLNGAEVFRKTFAAIGSSTYRQPCFHGFCKPDPREAFTTAFTSVFAQLSEALAAFDMRPFQETTFASSTRSYRPRQAGPP